MEEEIDLRKYLKALTKRWKWIVVLGVVAAVTAAIVSFFVLQPIYGATALVLITRPRYQLRFDPRLETLSDIETTPKAYPSLAKSDDLLLRVLNTIDPPLPENEQSLQKLRRNVNARTGADPSLLQLKVTSSNPERAAHIANTWADQYVEYVNELYGRRSEDVLFFTEQLDTARATLEEIEDALIDHEAHSQQAIIETRLTAKTVALSDYLNAQHELSNVIENARVLRQQLDEHPASAPASLGNDLTALLLEIQGLSRNTELPLQLQIAGGGSLSNRTVKEQADALSDLITALEIRLAEIGEQEVTLTAEIPPLQEALQQATTEKERLTREWEVADGTFTTLANKVEEARISAQDETGEVRLASQASEPTRPVSPNKLMNIAAAAFLGVFLGILAALFIEYWQSPR
jgi:capsular polysaccharide biosynthesis protein/chaperonin cofactor prefoldin